ncbi:MAG: phosphatase PAP2 family protein [Bacteroidota bacterium]|nr:phosphatase PAP2 family protein [Bacteroidota bacterium]
MADILGSLWHKLEAWDKSLYILLNSKWTNDLFDSIMPYMRNSIPWLPVYLFLFVFVALNFKKNGWWWIVFFICTVALTDITSSQLIKESFRRVRPCNDPDFISYVRLLVNCPVGYGFTSSHAANHFGMATFFFLTFRHIFKKWSGLLFIWAALIGYAQIYVGVHYPLDIAGGVVAGVSLGALTGVFFHKRFGLIIFDKQPNA